MRVLILPLLVFFSLFYNMHSYGFFTDIFYPSKITPENEELALQKEAKTPNGASALRAAIRYGDYDRAEKLLKYGARDPKGGALMSLIQDGKNDDLLYRLIRDYRFKDPFGAALKAAVKAKKIDVIEELLKYGSVPSKDPLTYAAKIAKSNPDLVTRIKHLREARDPQGYDLEAAIREENPGRINELLEYGARDPEGRALKAAIEKGNDELIERLLIRGAQDPEGWALRTAIEQKREALIDELLKCGAQDPNGKILEEAIYDGNEALVDKLLEYDGVQDSQGWALGAAIYAGNDALVDKLIAHGAQDPHDYALNAAMSKGNDALIEKIKQLKNPSSKHLKDTL